ncbi:SDR family NAD(P)-dependent oxidoreductase [Nocardia mexicana]|uniref:Short subunit dehydrogenase n=1 Tax=Nocardia mexicana TaxID=279262 RepID=A0A370GLT0_9NOCA|nr:SDR family NAD(P)-dependent oxidoreductase [Nocardia mexicana]RDI44718.1 short subunit dehydrogenase [Nocardia mexicana]
MSDNTIDHMADRTVLITGATDGLGRALAVRLGAAGARLILHGRNADRAAAVAAEITAAGGSAPEIVLADLSHLAAVERLADEIISRTSRLDVLVNNAGTGGRPDGTRALSADGHELLWAVNHLAPYRLTRRLLPLLRAAAPARVVNVASAGQQEIDLDDPTPEHAYDVYTAYCRAKLAMIMATIAYAEELDGTGVTVNALHPATLMPTTMVLGSGVTPIGTVAEGAAATLRLICEPSLSQTTGRYFNGTRQSRPHPQADDPKARRRLLEISDAAIDRP